MAGATAGKHYAFLILVASLTHLLPFSLLGALFSLPQPTLLPQPLALRMQTEARLYEQLQLRDRTLKPALHVPG